MHPRKWQKQQPNEQLSIGKWTWRWGMSKTLNKTKWKIFWKSYDRISTALQTRSSAAELRFFSQIEREAIEALSTTRYTEEITHFPTYMWKRGVWITISGIGPYLDLWWILACFCTDGDETPLDAKRSSRENWVGIAKADLIHMKAEKLEKVPDIISLSNGVKLWVNVEDRWPKYHIDVQWATDSFSVHRSRTIWQRKISNEHTTW